MDQNFSHLGPILYIFFYQIACRQVVCSYLKSRVSTSNVKVIAGLFLKSLSRNYFPPLSYLLYTTPMERLFDKCAIPPPPPYFQKRVCETNKQLYISSQACYWQPSTCPFYLRHHLICTGINITWSKNVELVAKYIIHIWFVQFVLISTERQTAVCFLVCQ